MVLVLLMFGFGLVVVIENNELRKEIKSLQYQKEKCTDLGICVGDVVIPTKSASEVLNSKLIEKLSFGTTVKRINPDNVLTLDMNDGSYEYLADTWMRKSECPANNLCLDLQIDVLSVTIDGITTRVK